MVGSEVLLIKSKYQCHLSQWQELVYGAQSWKEKRLLCESIIILIDRRALILKMVEIEAFLMKPKHQCHLSQ